ncbi:4Fe-4S dicluster domain-containing protein [uncultured Rubinisphaera sp.]|uniref:4Fe-4S dicluster domain-containing protein n=1 Tax=uncultured Rubinisphaera sp. TaxID=1678686 RepID=UPI0030D74D15|tara:strand:- start:825 stop:1928 length:1104 start_codon:yes stop_codon:yes gene_type:complete
MMNDFRYFRIDQFPEFLKQLMQSGYRVIAPTIDQEAIVYAEIQSIDDMPQGYTDEQKPGYYRLQLTGNQRFFDYAVGPHSWKRYLFPPLQLISTSIKSQDGWTFEDHVDEGEPYAFLGVRACELAAMRIQDRVFLEGSYVDTNYQNRRNASFIVAVNCAVPSANCFCTSMNTGPKCKSGFDIALTELSEGFLMEIGSSLGSEMVTPLGFPIATEEQLTESESISDHATEQIKKTMDTTDLRNRLMGQLEHSHWKEVADRCLSCTNCTMVCPTCFCSHVEEVPDLNQERVDRRKSWDSCFNPGFSKLHGTPVRNDTRSRYRQWLTHKLATWHDQFGESGCVGCGRCITWCPVGIDLTVEVAALCEEEP